MPLARVQHHAAEHEVADARGIPGQQHEAQRAIAERVAIGHAARRQQRLRVQREEHRIRQPPSTATHLHV